MVNQVPICAFSGYREWEKAQFVQQVKKQRLRAKSVLRFGAYAPWCVNETCDQIPSLECVAEVAGDTITVRTRYYGDHKDGSHCTEECRPITAACDTPELAAGTYQIKYGDRSFSVRLPSVLRAPCFGTDKAPTATKPSARGAAARP